jgi:hypothetical protein
MHSRDDDAALCAHDRGKASARRTAVSRIARAQEIGLSILIAEEKTMRSASLASSARCSGENADRAVAIDPSLRAGFVGATNLVPKLEQKCRDTAHPATCYADKMNLMMLTREQFRKVKLRGVLHGSYISPWL